MDFSFSGEQQQLRDAVRRYLSQEYSFEARNKIIHGAGTSPQIWAGLAELGLLGVPVPEEHGGFGANGVDLLVVMEELGRGLVIEPYFATAVLGAALLAGAIINPRVYSPAHPNGRLRRRQQIILGRLGGVAVPD